MFAPQARAIPRPVLERAIAEGLSLDIQTQVEVERLVAERGSKATLISVLDRTTGRRSNYCARRYALGARDRIIALVATIRTE